MPAAPTAPAFTAAAAASRDWATRLTDAIVATATAEGGGGLPAGTPDPRPPISWGLAHVLSRAFSVPRGAAGSGHGGGPALLPVVDLANHAAGATDPAWSHAPGSPHGFATLRPTRGRERAPVALAPGDEVTVSYRPGGGGPGDGGGGGGRVGPPLLWFLHYGFVPPEAWGPETRRRRRRRR